MTSFGKDRFPKKYQTHVGMSAGEKLHKNSIELVDILNKHLILQDNINIFEMGAGPCRNLYYIHKSNNNVNLYCNDLFYDASFSDMHNDIKTKVIFYEGDSEEIFSTCKVKNIDLLLISDHMMHLQYEKAENIITNILELWNPKHILLREIKKEGESVTHPKLYHRYDRFLEKYSIIEDTSSTQDNLYFIWLLKKK